MHLENGFYDVPPGKLATVVTHLEMTQPAAIRPVPLPQGGRFHRVDRPDVAWYRDLFYRVGARDWLWTSRLRMSPDDLSKILTDPKVHIYTVTVSEEDEAILELDFRDPGSCELAFFGVTEKLVGAGFGRFLMNEAITRAWAEPITRFWVHTCTLDSPQALPFYVRSGFTPVRQEVEIADDPRIDGMFPDDFAPRIPIYR